MPSQNVEVSGRAWKRTFLFIEKHSPTLSPWQRELVRIGEESSHSTSIRSADQGDERRLGDLLALHFDQSSVRPGLVDDGFMVEFLQSHTNVIAQRGFDERGYQGIILMPSVRHDARHPASVRAAPPTRTVIGSRNSPARMGKAARFRHAQFQDESFIAQYLSPRLIREFHLLQWPTIGARRNLHIDSIHDDEGYRRVRRVLAEQHKRKLWCPISRSPATSAIAIVRLPAAPDCPRRPVVEREAQETLKHLARYGASTCASKGS